MMKAMRLFSLALIAGLSVSFSYSQGPKWDKSINIEVRAPDHRPDGKTWDMEIPVLIGALMPTAGDPAPDMMLCIVDGGGQENCIHDAKRNPAGVVYSICPNRYVCAFSNVKAPATGYYGALVIDLDVIPSRQDFMLAAVLRNGGPEDPQAAWKIEKALKALAQKWHAVGVPEEFPESDAGECTTKDPCFGDSRGGIPSLAIAAQDVKTCGMEMSGTLEFRAASTPGTVAFEFQGGANECPNSTEYKWNFGDGSGLTTTQPRATHRFDRGAQYTVTIAPRCVRTSSVCEAKTVSTSVTVAH